MDQTFAAQGYRQLGNETVASGRTAVADATAVADEPSLGGEAVFVPAHLLAPTLQETLACGFAEQPSAEYDDGHASLAGGNQVSLTDTIIPVGMRSHHFGMKNNIIIQGEWTEPNESECRPKVGILCGNYGGDRSDRLPDSLPNFEQKPVDPEIVDPYQKIIWARFTHDLMCLCAE